MSKKLEAEINCPSCHHKFPMELYRTLWVEHPENMDLVVNDRVNVMKCPECGHSQRLPFSLLCTNVKKHIALWYEPTPDQQIDKDIEGYKRIMGADSFYAKAERVRDWGKFKEKLVYLQTTMQEQPPLRPKIPDLKGFGNSASNQGGLGHGLRLRVGEAIPELAATALLLIAVMLDSRDTEEGFYDFLRLAITGCAGYLGYRAIQFKHKLWVWIFAGIVMLYNPVFRVHLDRDDWYPLNALCAGVFLTYAYYCQRKSFR